MTREEMKRIMKEMLDGLSGGWNNKEQPKKLEFKTMLEHLKIERSKLQLSPHD